MPTFLLALLLPVSHAALVEIRGNQLCRPAIQEGPAELCLPDVPLENAGIDLVQQVRGFEALLDEKGELREQKDGAETDLPSIGAGVGLPAAERAALIAKYAYLRVTNLAGDQEHATKTTAEGKGEVVEVPFFGRIVWATIAEPNVERVGSVTGHLVFNEGGLNGDNVKPGTAEAQAELKKLVRIDKVEGEGLTEDLVVNTIAPAVIADVYVNMITSMVKAWGEALGRAVGGALRALGAEPEAAPAPQPTPPPAAGPSNTRDL